MNRKIQVMVFAACFLLGTLPAVARDYKDYRGYRLLSIKPEQSWMLGMYHSSLAAFRLFDFDMVESGPEILENPEKLAGFDLIFTGTNRKFTPKQEKGLCAYLDAKGAVYGNWGGPLNSPMLRKKMGFAKHSSLHSQGIILDGKFWGQINADNKLIFPFWIGHTHLKEKQGKLGLEMCRLEALNPADVIAWDLEKIPMAVFHRTEGGGRALTLGFKPENNKSFIGGQAASKKMLEKMFSVLLPDPPRNPDRSGNVELALPSICQVKAVKINGKTVSVPVRPFGSLFRLKLPLARLKPGETAEVEVDFRKTEEKNISPAIAFPSGNHISFDRPSDMVDFLKYLHAESFYSLVHNAYGSVYYSKCLPGYYSRVNPNYKGDFLKDFLVLAKKNGIKMNAGFYFLFNKTALDKTKPVRIGKDGKPQKNGTMVCLLDETAWDRSFQSMRRLLADYPEIDRLELDDNFEMDGNSGCYCARCVEKFHKEYPGVKPGPDSPEWDRFWRAQGEKLLKQVRAIADEAGKKLNGARDVWVKEGNVHKYLDRHCAMIYSVPAYSCSEGIRVLPERGAYQTILWGMDRNLDEIDTDVREAVFGGSVIISYWLHFYQRKDADNRWRIGMPKVPLDPQKPRFYLKPGTFEAVSRAFGRLEKHFRDYYVQYLLQGDCRYTVTKAVMDKDHLRVTIKNTGKRTPAVTGPVDFAGFFGE